MNYNKQMLAWVDEARALQMQKKDPGPALEQAKQSFQASERAFLDVIDIVPTEYDNYVFLTALYNQAGSYFDPAYFEQAVAMSDRGIECEEYGPAVRFHKALALYSLRRIDEAIIVLKETVPMDPAYTDPALMLAELYADKGDKVSSRATYEAVLSVAPTSSPPGSRALAGLAALDGTAPAGSSPATP
jgi:tetratricopeptide (TPR) repeat protein